MIVSTGENRPGGGICLYIRNDLTYRMRNDLSIELIDIDIIFIEIPKTNLNTNTNILIGVCYRLPHVLATEFIEKLDEILQKLQRKKLLFNFVETSTLTHYVYHLLQIVSQMDFIILFYHTHLTH